MRRFLAFFTAVAHLVLADAVVKEWAVGRLRCAGPTVVVPNFFNLAYVENRGCAWGMFQGHVWPLAVFGVVALALCIWKRRAIFGTGRLAAVTACLLYAGIVGNLVDRLWRGCVIDMFDFHWGIHHFPCFNLADSYISVAAVLMLAFAWFDKKEK